MMKELKEDGMEYTRCNADGSDFVESQEKVSGAEASGQESVEEGYSSKELPAETDGEKSEVEAAEQSHQATESVNWGDLAKDDKEEEKPKRTIPGQKGDDE